MAHIIVVDDHPVNRDVLRILLKRHGYRISEASDGAEALALVRAEPPDLVISDILMPTMDGYEFVRQLRADPALEQTQVIFYTAHFHEREARNLARACGVTRVLSKPSEPAEIVKAVEQALARQPEQAAPHLEKEFDREHLRLMTDKLSQKNAELKSANLRLAALTELNLRFASERDPKAMLDGVCSGARDLIGSKYAFLCVDGRNGSAAPHFTVAGMDAATAARLLPPEVDALVFGTVTRERRAHRRSTPPGSGALELPPGCPPASCMVVAPIASLETVYGWICLIDKLGREEFDDEDERILTILGAQVGRIYENGILYLKTKRSEDEVRRLNADLEKRVAERTVELKAINQELQAFDYSVSHDLRAPLNRIRGFSAMLLEENAAKLDERGVDLLRRLALAGETMEQLIGDLLQLSTVATGALRRSHVDVSALAQTVLSALEKAQPDRQVDFTVEPGMSVSADPGLVRIVLENLLGNAWKFTAKRNGTRIEIGWEKSSGQAPAFFVRDNGAGFDEAGAPKLFLPFQRLHAQSEFDGTGIGLATVQRIVRRHGGRVWAEGAVGKGATFHFTLAP